MVAELFSSSFFTLQDGGRLRFVRFEPTGAPQGTVLIVPGRREFIEKKFPEVGAPLLSRNLRLIFVEPRGQGLSSRFLDGEMRQRDHIKTFDTHLNDLREFVAGEVMRDCTGPLYVNGHSMGGHLLLRWLAEDQPAVAGALLTSPMVALSNMPAHMLAHGVSWVGVNVFDASTEYAPTQHDYDESDKLFDNNPLTRDEARFAVMETYFRDHPQLTVGGVTWAWVLAAMASMQKMHVWPYLNQIKVPVLAMLGGQDGVTPISDVTPHLNQIPGVQISVIADARHDILNEALATRARAWQHINAFLDNLIQKAA